MTQRIKPAATAASTATRKASVIGPYIKPTESAAGGGFIQGMTALSALILDDFTRDQLLTRPISFGVGIPDHSMPQEMIDSMKEAANCVYSPYPDYDLYSERKESAGAADIAAFHSRHFGIDFTEDQAILTCGASPVLAACAYITCEPGSKVVSIHPSYPLMALPVEKNGASIDTTAYLEPGTDGRWSVNADSFKNALNINRSDAKEGGAAMMYLNFPGNPTGYAPTLDEYVLLANIIADDIHTRKLQGLIAY